jgi:uncharacterized protein (DUF2236 family)
VTAAGLYGATGAPASVADQEKQFAAMRPRLEPSPIVFEFLEILQRTPIFPGPLRPLQAMLIRASVEITPGWVREILGLDARFGLRRFEASVVRAFGRLSDRFVVPSSPPAQACQRLGVTLDSLRRR